MEGEDLQHTMLSGKVRTFFHKEVEAFLLPTLGPAPSVSMVPRCVGLAHGVQRHLATARRRRAGRPACKWTGAFRLPRRDGTAWRSSSPAASACSASARPADR